jgi:hypothetical protein
VLLGRNLAIVRRNLPLPDAFYLLEANLPAVNDTSGQPVIAS